MPPYHISSTSRALFRVFIAPNLPPSSTTPLRIQHTFLVPRFNNIAISQTAIRHKTYSKKDTQRHALSDYYIFDNRINAPYINMVDQDGQYHTGVSLDDALRSYNRVTHHLVQMSPGKVDESGDPDPNHPPMCKVTSKMDLRNQLQRKLDIERRKAKGQGAKLSSKNLELNWAIAGGDLKHRLEKLKGFLREGRKVEILLGPKRKGRKATPDEAKAVLAAVIGAVGECKGAGEVKREGNIGGVFNIVFEGRKIDDGKKAGE